YLPNRDGGLTYYTAIRVPQALENPKLMRLAKRGVIRQEHIVALEKSALGALRAYDRANGDLDEALDAVMAYAAPATLGITPSDLPGSRAGSDLRALYRRTLIDKPWRQCDCAICRAISIEVVIFRASNRNKRRGIHNLGVFKALVDQLPEGRQSKNGHDDVL